jgi:hypothetical protein
MATKNIINENAKTLSKIYGVKIMPNALSTIVESL